MNFRKLDGYMYLLILVDDSVVYTGDYMYSHAMIVITCIIIYMYLVGDKYISGLNGFRKCFNLLFSV